MVDGALSLPVLREVTKPLEFLYDTGFAGMARTVDTMGVVGKYSADDVKTIEEIQLLSLRRPDEEVDNFGATYAGLAAAEGGALGAVSLLPGVGSVVALGLITTDALAVTSLAMRAVCDYSAHYGFDPASSQEQAFMKGVLGLAGLSDQAEKAALLRELSEISLLIARRATWDQLRQRTAVRAAEQAAKVAGHRLIKRELAIAVPVAGAVIGASVNGWFLSQIDDAARMSYRRRIIDQKKRVLDAA